MVTWSSFCIWNRCVSARANFRRLNFSNKRWKPSSASKPSAVALIFSLVKHIGLTFIGLSDRWPRPATATPGWQALVAACLLVGFFTVIGTYIIPRSFIARALARLDSR